MLFLHWTHTPCTWVFQWQSDTSSPRYVSCEELSKCGVYRSFLAFSRRSGSTLKSYISELQSAFSAGTGNKENGPKMLDVVLCITNTKCRGRKIGWTSVFFGCVVVVVCRYVWLLGFHGFGIRSVITAVLLIGDWSGRKTSCIFHHSRIQSALILIVKDVNHAWRSSLFTQQPAGPLRVAWFLFFPFCQVRSFSPPQNIISSAFWKVLNNIHSLSISVFLTWISLLWF